MFRLFVLGRPHVLFCGGQVGCTAVFLAVQLESVVPFPVSIPQRHCLSPGFGIASTFRRILSGTRCACQLSNTQVLSSAISSLRAWPARGPDCAPVPPAKANCPLGYPPLSPLALVSRDHPARFVMLPSGPVSRESTFRVYHSL